ncbi:MAG: Uncharacterised protein [SAR116 cluster bacterium MED-G04]|nr:MAG: Uncharacterised protein [SAR116 cluster bacterium MED-G04]
MAFHVFRHIKAHQLDAEAFGELACHLCLADPGGAAEEVIANRLVRFAQPGPSQLDGRRQGNDGFILTIDHAFQISFEAGQCFAVITADAAWRDAGHGGDRCLNLTLADNLFAA